MKGFAFLALFLGATLAAGQANPPKSEWEKQQEERDFKENEAAPPAMPKGAYLIEFFVTSASSFKFFIDAPSLSVGTDGVVRYTLVARSPAGAETISYEGIRCNTGSYKVFAHGYGGTWSRSSSDWRPIEPKSVQRWHNVLRSNFFCPQQYSIQTAAEGLDALGRGGHPAVDTTGHGR